MEILYQQVLWRLVHSSDRKETGAFTSVSSRSFLKLGLIRAKLVTMRGAMEISGNMST